MDAGWRAGAVAALAVMLAAGCSGGGGDSPPPPPPPPPPPATYVVAGVVLAADHNAVDGDVNDPLADYGPNDEPLTAQQVSNPVTLGGYVNQPGTGRSGRSQVDGDVSDFFRLSLTEGQVIQLVVADVALGDADLYLWDAAGANVLDSALDTTELSTLLSPADGEFLLEVTAYSGATNYVLSVGQRTSAAVPGELRLSLDFVPGEAVLRTDPDMPSAIADGVTGMSLLAGSPGRLARMRLPLAEVATRMATPQADDRRSQAFAGMDEALRDKWATLMAIKSLRARPGIALAEPNYRVKAMAVPNDPFVSLQWHYGTINLAAAWDYTGFTSDAVVAVVDTGVLLNHPDLAGRLVAGYDFVSDPSIAVDGGGIDSNPDDPGDQPGAGSSFHGTHVAGTIAAATRNGLGVAGVAEQARVMPLRVLGLGGTGTSYDVLQGVRFAAGLPNDSGTVPARRADVINLSLGGTGFSQAEQDVYRQVRNLGVIVVAAAGNDASSVPQYPASYEGVVSVSAVSLRRIPASYSSFGPAVDVAAPGGDFGDENGDGYVDGVLSTGGDDRSGSIEFGYVFLQGTSMAAPHVAGVAALMRAVNSSLTPDVFDVLLSSGELTVDEGVPGRDDRFGYGTIDAGRAIAAAAEAGQPDPTPRLVVSPEALNFGALTTTAQLTVINGGTGQLTLDAVSENLPWLEVVPPVGGGFGLYTLQVSRSGLAPGTYQGSIEFASSANTVIVQVIMQVADLPAFGDAGFHYVLLIDPVSGEAVGQDESDAIEGRYAYRFEDVEEGVYQIFAGTDADNDGFICDPGEACGAYLTLDQPLEVTVEGGNRANLDFNTRFQVLLSTQQQSKAGSGPGIRRQPARALPR